MKNRIPVLELLVALNPDNPKAHRFLGECIEKVDGRGSTEALGHYQRAHELLPTFPQYLANIGRCLLAQRGGAERFVALVDGLDDSVHERAVNPYVHDIYSRCLEGMGEKEQASRYRQEQIRQVTRNPAIYNDEAVYLREQKRYPEAVAVLEQAERAGVMNDYLWAVKAGVLQDNGQGAKASCLRQEHIQAGSRDPTFIADEAAYLRDQGKYSSALELLEQAEERGCANEVTDTIRHGIEQRARRQQNRQSPGPVSEQTSPMPTRGAHTILFLAANPHLDLRLDEEVRAIREGLQRARERDGFQLHHRGATRPEDWRRAMLELQPTIVQFSGHGSQGAGILLQGRTDDTLQPASATALGGLFALFTGKVDCVILNACYSEPQARAIAAHVPYVVGMQDAIGDTAAREFATAFYDALGAGQDFEFAFRLGCNALDFHGMEADKVMVLFKAGERICP